MKKFMLAIVAVFICWSVLDFIIHSLLLMDAYAKTAELWRPMEEMKMGLMNVITLIVAIVFVYIYHRLIAEKNFQNGCIYGALFGVAMGISMGYGTYSVMPVPHTLAISWFLGNVVEFLAAGAIVGYLLRKA